MSWRNMSRKWYSTGCPVSCTNPWPYLLNPQNRWIEFSREHFPLLLWRIWPEVILNNLKSKEFRQSSVPTLELEIIDSCSAGLCESTTFWWTENQTIECAEKKQIKQSKSSTVHRGRSETENAWKYTRRNFARLWWRAPIMRNRNSSWKRNWKRNAKRKY